MEKAPDAFRTISEVADDLDIPQHVLRFWETRFSQIRPMKRSGGRRYYRPDDVDLLKGIRHLLYGEGYTIRGVQRILKEQGLKSVQGLAAGAVLPDAMRAAAQVPPHEADDDASDAVAEEEADELAEPGVAPLTVRPAAPAMQAAAPPLPALTDAARIRLQSALQDLLGCRQLLDEAMKRA